MSTQKTLKKIELKKNEKEALKEIIENKDFWNTPLANAMPLHWNIDREGIAI